MMCNKNCKHKEIKLTMNSEEENQCLYYFPDDIWAVLPYKTDSAKRLGIFISPWSMSANRYIKITLFSCLLKHSKPLNWEVRPAGNFVLSLWRKDGARKETICQHGKSVVEDQSNCRNTYLIKQINK